MAFDLNKSGEDKSKSKFNLSKSSEPLPEVNNEKGTEESKKKFDLSKSSGATLPPDVKKGAEEPKKKFDISKQSEPAHHVPGKKEISPVTAPVKNKSNRTILFSILGFVCLALLVWVIVNKTKTPDNQNAETAQVPVIDPQKNDAGSPAIAEGDVKQTGNSTSPADTAKPAATAQTKSQADGQPSQSGNNSPGKKNQDQPKQSAKTGESVSKSSPSVNTNIPYKKNELYRLYQFPFGDFNYSQADPDLDKLVDVLRQNPSMKISIFAYTDDIGDADFNMALSERRAKSILDYLTSKGIDSNRMKSQGKGISTTYGTKSENRRAEFTLSE